MDINIISENGIEIAAVCSKTVIISDVQSAIDFIATIRYTTTCDTVILNKEALGKKFFDLSSGLAGEVIQKFVNYRMPVAIVGDFSKYKSTSLRDFIYECNNGNHIYFAKTNEEAIKVITSKSELNKNPKG